ncbi:AraC family transcriptional regulator, partial [Pseudoalteromonas sp. SIMBA_153]
MADLTQRLLPLLTKESLTQTAIDDISLMHLSNPSQARPIIYRPAVCFMLQGAKELLVGNTKVTYEQMNYLLIPVMLPVSGRVSQASPDKP